MGTGTGMLFHQTNQHNWGTLEMCCHGQENLTSPLALTADAEGNSLRYSESEVEVGEWQLRVQEGQK